MLPPSLPSTLPLGLKISFLPACQAAWAGDDESYYSIGGKGRRRKIGFGQRVYGVEEGEANYPRYSRAPLHKTPDSPHTAPYPRPHGAKKGSPKSGVEQAGEDPVSPSCRLSSFPLSPGYKSANPMQSLSFFLSDRRLIHCRLPKCME